MIAFIYLLFLQPNAQAYISSLEDLLDQAAAEASFELGEEVSPDHLDYLSTITVADSPDERIHMLVIKEYQDQAHAIQFFKENDRVYIEERDLPRVYPISILENTGNPKGQSIFRQDGIDALFLRAKTLELSKIDLDLYYVKNAIFNKYKRCDLQLLQDNQQKWNLALDNYQPVSSMQIDIGSVGIRNMGIPCEN